MVTRDQLRKRIIQHLVEGIRLPNGINILSLTNYLWKYINKTASTIRVRDFKYVGSTSILMIEDNYKNQLMLIVIKSSNIEFLMPGKVRINKYNKKPLSIATILVLKGVENYLQELQKIKLAAVR